MRDSDICTGQCGNCPHDGNCAKQADMEAAAERDYNDAIDEQDRENENNE